MLSFGLADGPPDVVAAFLDEPPLAFRLVNRVVGEQPTNQGAPRFKPLEELLKVRANPPIRPEVSEEQRIGLPGENEVGAAAPCLEIDVRRRSRRQNI
jgi:hypothetical protein